MPHYPYVVDYTNDTNSIKYLGYFINTDTNVNHRIRCASMVKCSLKQKVWFKEKALTRETKRIIYKSMVMPVLLFSLDSMCLYERHLKQLERFHKRASSHFHSSDICIRNVLSMYNLRFTCHVQRSNDLSKIIMYSEITHGRRNRGRPKLRFKDYFKRNLKNRNIDTERWGEIAQDRTLWRSITSSNNWLWDLSVTTAYSFYSSRYTTTSRYNSFSHEGKFRVESVTHISTR